jgi:sulfatase maturation enzyme AslB (radical SAM superfamily)
MGLSVHNGGHVSLCNGSKTMFANAVGETITLDKDSLQDAWNSPTRLEIQKDLDSGIPHSNCVDCWNIESAGFTSPREIHNNTLKELTALESQPRAVFLKPGNLCNLACRHCDPRVSTGWYRDYYRAKIDPLMSYNQWVKTFDVTRRSYATDNNNTWGTLESWLPELAYFDLYGAEPLLIDPLFQLLKKSSDNSYSNRQSIHINTNGTIWADEFYAVFQNFKNVSLDVSVDGINDQFNYMRYPANWNHVLDNIKKYKSIPNINLSITITVSIYNIWYINQIVEYFNKLNIYSSINILHSPEHLCIKNLPNDIKQSISTHLLSTKQHHLIDNIVNFINEPGINLMAQFFDFTDTYDQLRNQQFQHTFSEMYNLLKSYE